MKTSEILESHPSLDGKTICIHYADGEVVIIKSELAKEFGL